jgi:multidrug resistance efflux pump
MIIQKVKGGQLLCSFEEPDSQLVLVQYERAMRHEAQRLKQLKVPVY